MCNVHATFAMCTLVLRSGKYRSLCLVTVSAVSVLRPSYQYWYRSTNIMKIVQSVRLRLSRQASVTGDSSIGLMSFYWSSINQWVYSIIYQHIQDKAFFVGFSRPARSLQCCITSNHQPCLGDTKISGKVLSVILYNVRFNTTGQGQSWSIFMQRLGWLLNAYLGFICRPEVATLRNRIYNTGLLTVASLPWVMRQMINTHTMK